MLRCFQRAASGPVPVPGLALAMSPVVVWSPEFAGFAADAAPSACATSERKSETCRWDSTPQLSAPPAPSLWAAEGAVSSKLVWWMQRRRQGLGSRLGWH